MNPLTKLLEGTRRLRPRAKELRAVRTRMSQAPSREQLSGAERALGDKMRGLRREILRATGAVRACSTCATGCELPNGRWDGGFCCGGRTEDIFSDVELAVLRASGTRPADLRPPRGELAGCVFRGPTACSLPAQHRPNVCISYICRDLTKELAQRGDLEANHDLVRELQQTFDIFERTWADRTEEALFASWAQ